MGSNFKLVPLVKRTLRELSTLNQAVRMFIADERPRRDTSARLVDELRSINTALLGIQKQIGSIRDQQGAANQQQQQREKHPQILNAELRIPEAEQQEKRTNDKKHYRVQVAIAIATSLAFLAAGIYAGIAGYQAFLTRRIIHDNQSAFEKTLCEMRAQTKASQDQADLFKQQLSGTLGAVIKRQFTIVWPSRKAYLTAVLSNRGKTIASNVKGRLKLDVGYIQNGEFIGEYSAPWNFDAPEVFPDPEMPTEIGTYLNLSEEAFSSKSEIPKAIKVTGGFSYFNGFRMQSRSVCYYVMGRMMFYNKRGEWQATLGGESIPCDELAAELAGFGRAKQQYEQ